MILLKIVGESKTDAKGFHCILVLSLRDRQLLVSMECNREFEADGLYIRGMDYMKLCQHDGLKKLWQTELEM